MKLSGDGGGQEGRAALSPADIAEGLVVIRTVIIELELYDPNFIGAPYEDLVQ